MSRAEKDSTYRLRFRNQHPIYTSNGENLPNALQIERNGARFVAARAYLRDAHATIQK